MEKDIEMGNARIESGFVALKNEILDALCGIRIPGEVRQVIDFVIRKTLGFRKKTDWISLDQFCLATGLNKPNVVRAINQALSMNLIIKKGNGKKATYGFNKIFSTWNMLPKKIIIIKNDNNSLSKKIPTINNTINNTLSEIQTDPFGLFYLSYPKKEARQKALMSWKKLNPSGELFEIIMQAVEKQASRKKYLKTSGQFCPEWPMPATWLNQKRWEDEIPLSVHAEDPTDPHISKNPVVPFEDLPLEKRELILDMQKNVHKYSEEDLEPYYDYF
jgi:phage replication O-like protein O